MGKTDTPSVEPRGIEPPQFNTQVNFLTDAQFEKLQRTMAYSAVMSGVMYQRPNATLTAANLKTIFEAAELVLEQINA